MDFVDNNFPPKRYSTDMKCKISDALNEIANKVVTNICPLCGKELMMGYVDMYDHEYGWDVISEIPKQWLSFRCHKCKYDVSLNKLGVNRW